MLPMTLQVGKKNNVFILNAFIDLYYHHVRPLSLVFFKVVDIYANLWVKINGFKVKCKIINFIFYL